MIHEFLTDHRTALNLAYAAGVGAGYESPSDDPWRRLAPMSGRGFENQRGVVAVSGSEVPPVISLDRERHVEAH